MQAWPPVRHGTAVGVIRWSEVRAERRPLVFADESEDGQRNDRRVKQQSRLAQDEGLASDEGHDCRYIAPGTTSMWSSPSR